MIQTLSKTALKRWMMALSLSIILYPLSISPARAQSNCGVENTSFRSGEYLSYDLKFNWQFVWMKVGTASMSTVLSTYDGKPAYRTTLTTGGNSRLDNLFTMRDTLVTYCNMNDLSPLYYRKGAKEGKHYYVDELWYSYPGNGKTHVKMHRQHRSGKHSYDEQEFEQCINDMLSIFLKARNFDASTMKKGDIIPMPIMDAKKLTDSWLIFRGTETYKLEGGTEKFRCLVFSFVEKKKNKKSHELIRFYVTDDKNHMPVRLDMDLSFGKAKAFLRSYQGVRNELTSKVK